MALLDAFIMQFMTEGLDEIPDSAKEADEQLDKLADTTENAEEKTQEFSDSAKAAADSLKEEGKAADETKDKLEDVDKATKETAKSTSKLGKGLGSNGLASFLVEGVKKFSPYILAMTALRNSFKSLNEAVDLNMPISRETVNNIKDIELTMRDIRSGAVQIGTGIAEMILPVIKKVADIAKVVFDFFREHERFIKVAFIATIIAMGVALWGALAPILPELLLITAAIAGVSLVVEDFISWLNGGTSALEDFWNEIFGSADEAKAFFKEIWDLIKQVWEYLQPALDWLIKVALKGVILALKGIAGVIKAIINGIKSITGKNVDINENVNGSHAGGLDYVPYDGYIAKLHKGERIQTASEANDWRSGLIAAKKAINFTASYPLNSIPTGAVSNAYNNSSSNRTINIGDITIQTQATSAQGIADDLASAIKRAVISLDDGMLA